MNEEDKLLAIILLEKYIHHMLYLWNIWCYHYFIIGNQSYKFHLGFVFVFFLDRNNNFVYNFTLLNKV